MSNILKYGFVNFQEGDTKVIDSNKIVEKRLGSDYRRTDALHTEEGFREAQFEELDEETRKALYGDEEGNIYREKPVYDGPSPEELIEAAKQEIEEMRALASQEIEGLRSQAIEEGRAAGYNEGLSKGHEEAMMEADKAEKKAQEAIRETEALRDQLRREYEARVQELEPMMIDELTDIYDHVFASGLKEKSNIIFHLLDTTLHRIDSGREFIVRISQDDYEYVNENKDELLNGMPGVRMDLVADVLMHRGEGIIETGGGLFDCSIDVELKELKNRIHTLAYQSK